MNDVINPAYYKGKNGTEAIDVVDEFFHDNTHLGTAFCYMARCGKKGDAVEDLEKAIWWLTHYKNTLIAGRQNGDKPETSDDGKRSFILAGLQPQHFLEGFHLQNAILQGELEDDCGVFGIDDRCNFYAHDHRKTQPELGEDHKSDKPSPEAYRERLEKSLKVIAEITPDNYILNEALVRLPVGSHISVGGETYIRTQTNWQNSEKPTHVVPLYSIVKFLYKKGGNAYASPLTDLTPTISGLRQLKRDDVVRILDNLPTDHVSANLSDLHEPVDPARRFKGAFFDLDNYAVDLDTDPIEIDGFHGQNSISVIRKVLELLPVDTRCVSLDGGVDVFRKIEAGWKHVNRDVYDNVEDFLRDVIFLKNGLKITST